MSDEPANSSIPRENYSPRRDLFSKQISRIERLTVRFFSVLFILLLVYSASVAVNDMSIAKFLHSIGMLLAVALAASALGGFLGFLFGIPRLLQRSVGQDASSAAKPPGDSSPAARDSPTSAKTVSSRLYGSNSNLEEVSDWITKIIVGLGLVEANTLFDNLWKAAAIFKAANPDAVGADILFVLTCIAAAAGGFLFFYLETRTRIIMLLADAENAVGELGLVDKAVVSAANKAPILDVSEAAVDRQINRLAAAPPKEDLQLLTLPVSNLKGAAEFAAWGSAQARAGNLRVASSALQQAINLKPLDKDLLIKLADTRALEGRWEDSAKTLEEAEQAHKDDPDILRRQLLVSLYAAPPEGFRRAIAIADKLAASSEFANDPAIYLWSAAAQGQRASYCKNRDSEEYQDARGKALAAARKLIQLDRSDNGWYKKLMRGMLDPSREGTPAQDNDLEVFKGDEDFENLLFG